jgi:hypothetical protein
MIQEPLINPLKHKSSKEVIKKLYSQFGIQIHSLINQSGNLFEVVLEPNGNFEAVVAYLKEFADEQLEFSVEYCFNRGDGFSMIFLSQIGNDKRHIETINARHFSYELEYNGEKRTFHLVQLRGSNIIDVYMDFMFMEVLRKNQGKWHMFIYEDLAQELGSLVEKDKLFRIP